MPSARKTKLLHVLLLAPLLLAGCEEKGQVRTYESAMPASYNWPTAGQREAKHAEGGVDWVWDVPADWADAPELSSFHVADYRFPGASEALPGRLTVSVSAGDGGGLRENIQRWRGQLFIAPPKGPAPGDSVSPPMSVFIGSATIVEFSGQYQGEHVPTHLLGAIVQIPAEDGSVFQTWFFKMLGDRQTIIDNRLKLFRMMLSLRPEGVPAPELPEDIFERALPGSDNPPRPTPLAPEPVEPEPGSEEEQEPAQTP